MGVSARKIAVERFNWEIIAEKFNNIYKKYSLPNFLIVLTKLLPLILWIKIRLKKSEKR